MAGKTDEEVQRDVQQRLQEIELLRQEAQLRGLAFTAPSEEELTRKIAGETAQSPFVSGQSWSSTVPQGGSASYTVHVANPDSNGYFPLFATIFFGMANFLRDIGVGPAGRNLKWPYISSPPFSLAAGASASQVFSYQIPAGIPLATYTGNAVLWRGGLHDVGAYLDRGLFWVTVI
jgi:hypothetical protein